MPSTNAPRWVKSQCQLTTTKEVGQEAGLGLAAVHGIEVRHNGWVQVQSEVGVGLTFRVYLPERVGRERASARVDRGQCESGEGTILLADDDAGARKTVATSLERLGYCVIQALELAVSAGGGDFDHGLQLGGSRVGEGVAGGQGIFAEAL